MTMTGAAAEVDGTVAGAGGFELAWPETRNKTKIKNKIRKERSICCTVTGNYISTDELDKTKVAKNKKEENVGERQRRRIVAKL